MVLESADELQLAWLVMSWVVPSEKVPVALNSWVSPATIVALAGFMTMERSVGAGAVDVGAGSVGVVTGTVGIVTGTVGVDGGSAGVGAGSAGVGAGAVDVGAGSVGVVTGTVGVDAESVGVVTRAEAGDVVTGAATAGPPPPPHPHSPAIARNSSA